MLKQGVLLVVFCFLAFSMNGQCDQIEYNVYFDSQPTSVPASIQTGEVECYRITPNNLWSFGSIWSDSYVDLTSSFEYSYYVYLGNNDAGADGIVFVLSGDPLGANASGSPGGELGYAGMNGTQGIAPSIGIEFDTWNNGAPFGDIAADHVSLNVNGFMNTNTGDAVSLGNIEDGQYHLVEVIWDAIAMTLKVTFDGAIVIDENIDLINDVFNGDPNVLVGCTGSTGGASNEQIICDVQVVYTEQCNGIDDDCDGLIDEDLESTAELEEVICAGQSFTVGSSTYNQTGVYTDVLVNAVGCDSIIQTTLTVSDLVTLQNDVNLCEGESHTEGTSVYTQTGTYTDFYTDINGCDSTVITELQVSQLSFHTDEVVICEGESHPQGASMYTASGTYTDLYTNIAGCDSSVTTNLEVLNVDTTPIFAQFCPTTVFQTAQQSYNAPGFYEEWYTADNGCDSLVTLSLDFLPEASTFQERYICSGGQFQVGSAIHTAAGTYIDTLQAASGCDSIVTTILGVIDELNISDTTLCDGSIFELDMSAFPLHEVVGYDLLSNDIYSFNSTGLNSVMVDLDGCQLESDFSVSFRTVYQTKVFNIEACRDELLPLFPREIPVAYFWEDGSQDSVLVVSESGLYIIDYPHACGDFQDRYTVKYEACQCDVFIPNSFSADGDGLNDYFRVVHDCEFIDFKFSIYDRDGHLLFETSEPTLGWNGGLNGYYTSPGVYNWKLWFRTSVGDEIRTGQVNMIR